MQWFDPDHDYVNEYIDTWNQKIRSAKTWMIALGAVLVLTGIASAVAPLGMYALIQGLIAGLLIVRGGSNIASYIQTPAFFRNGATLAAGILNALLGVLFFALPSVLHRKHARLLARVPAHHDRHRAPVLRSEHALLPA